MGRNRMPWTPQEDALLIENHSLSETRLREMFPHRGGSGITQRKVVLRRAGKIPASIRRTAVKDWSVLGPVVLRMRKEGVPIHDIAVAVGCHDETIRAHLQRHGLPAPKKQSDKVQRNCLRCGRKFMAQGLFIRRCDDCKARERSREFA